MASSTTTVGDDGASLLPLVGYFFDPKNEKTKKGREKTTLRFFFSVYGG